MPRLLPLFFVVLLLFSSSAAAAASSSSASSSQGAESGAAPSRRGLVPVAPAGTELGLGAMAAALGINDTTRRRRRQLGGSFQLCAPCTCCGGARGACVLAPCCYAINCNIPNRPFGYCSFTPKSCDCLGCNL